MSTQSNDSKDLPYNYRNQALEADARLAANLPDTDRWEVSEAGLLVCRDCFCVFIPGSDLRAFLRYSLADGYDESDCACHHVNLNPLDVQ